MKKIKLSLLILGTLLTFASCSNNKENEEKATSGNEATENAAQPSGGQAMVNDDVSEKNVVKVAVGSKDHTTLVKALQAADLVNAMSNNGPFTVFAPTNAAFDALPSGTVDNLMKPENKDALANILYHHVQVSTYKLEYLHDGQILTMFDGTPATIHIKDGKYSIDNANILASIPATNGIVHVIDKVILPSKK